MNRPFLLLLFWILAVSPLAAGEDRLKAAQGVLKVQGYYFGELDGESSEETTQALKRFQVRNLLPVTGQLDETTAKVLEALGGSKSAPAPVAGAIVADKPASPATAAAKAAADKTTPTLPHPPGGGPGRDPVSKEAAATAAPTSAAAAKSTPAKAAPTPVPLQELAAANAKPSVTVAASTQPVAPRQASPPPVAATPAPAPAVAAAAPAPTAIPRILSATPTPAVVSSAAPAEPSPLSDATRRPPPGTEPVARGAGQPTSDRVTVVSKAQEILSQEGFYKGSINGTRDAKLYQALRQYQSAKGLPTSGELDQPTMDGLGMDRTAYAPPPKIVRQPAPGPRVLRAQRPEQPVVRAQRVQTVEIVETVETVTRRAAVPE